MKNVLIVVGMLVLFNAVLVFSGALDRLAMTNEEAVETKTGVQPDVIDVFRFTLEDEVNKKQGQPIEGYEPTMFMAVFPGLTVSDFAGVEASIGHYEVTNGKLQHVLDQNTLVHSAAGAITREGMGTLLENVAVRIKVDLTKDGTITDVMDAINIR